MSRRAAVLLSLVWTAACSGSPQPAPAGPGGPPPPLPPRVNGVQGGGIAAQVDNEIITWKDVDDRLKLPVKEITPQMRRPKLREMVEERLLLQVARRNHVTVSDQEVEDAIGREMKRFESEEQYDAYLRLQGLTRTENREKWRSTIMVTRLHYHLIRQAYLKPDFETPPVMPDFVTPEEIRKYYREHPDEFKAIDHISVLRIALKYGTPREKEQKRLRAESILRHLAEGTGVNRHQFFIQAHLYSDWRPTRNGVLEYGHRELKKSDAADYFASETVRLLFETLKVGEMSAIVEDGKAFNIFLKEAHFIQREDPFESEVQDKIKSKIENEKRASNRRELIRFLVNRAYVWPPNLFDSE